MKFTNAYGDIDEPFYNSVITSFADALKRVAENKSQGHFRDRCAAIVHDTRNIGWGFHDELYALYVDCYGEKPRR